KDVAARGCGPLRQTETQRRQILGRGRFALKRLDEPADEFIITRQREFKQIAWCERCLAKRRVNAPIGDILLNERLKEAPGYVNRRGIASFECKVNRDRLAA